LKEQKKFKVGHRVKRTYRRYGKNKLVERVVRPRNPCSWVLQAADSSSSSVSSLASKAAAHEKCASVDIANVTDKKRI
jgi:hypothetical protein